MEESGREAAVRALRILVLTDTPILGAGGSERFLRNLLGRLPQEYQVDVLQLCQKPAPEGIVGAMDESRVHIAYRPVGAIYGAAGLAAIAHVRRMVRSGNYDIVQSHHEKSDLINALLPRDSTRPRRLSNRRDMGFQKSRRMRWLMCRLNRRFDRIIAPSPVILDALVATENVATDKCVCIPNGVDTGKFAPANESDRMAARKEFGLADDDLLVGCVANLFPVKRHCDLIDALAQVRVVMPQTHLVLIGDGPLRPEIEAQIRSLGLQDAVHLLGDRDDIPRLLPALDLFALASSSEGLSNAILEAQACGLPVLATRVGGNPELVPEDSGRLVKAEDPPMLADAMIGLLKNPALRSRMGAAARARVERKHSLQAMVDAYASLYRDLIRER